MAEDYRHEMAKKGVHNAPGFNAYFYTELAKGDWKGGYGLAPCPVCQAEGRPDQRALSIGYSDDRVLVYCFKSNCRFHDIIWALGAPPSAKSLNPKVRDPGWKSRSGAVKHNLKKARELWQSAMPVSGTLAEGYLRNRGISCPLPSSLRFHPKAYYKDANVYSPALIALVSPTEGVHRTFLHTSVKSKSAMSKRMLGPVRGGAVECSGGSGAFVVCEGIETGLSLASGLVSGSPQIWAALSTSGMRNFSLPSTPRRLIIATDGDAAGRSAGDALGQRAHQDGWVVSFLHAPEGNDWNDVLQRENWS